MALRRALQFRGDDLPTPDRPQRTPLANDVHFQKVEVHTPSYSLDDDTRRKLPVSAHRTKDLFRLWSRRLHPEDAVYMKEMLLECRTLDGRYGSICSGMDIGATVMKQFWDWARYNWELHGAHFKHKFACEKDPAKRNFLLQAHPEIQHMFKDAVDMQHDTLFDTKLNTEIQMPLCLRRASLFRTAPCSIHRPPRRTIDSAWRQDDFVPDRSCTPSCNTSRLKDRQDRSCASSRMSLG